ncbi:MAG: J domain-containing protein [Ramlibacter sp.]
MTASHYDTLRVDQRASADEVRDAYRRMAQRCHPDRCQDDPEGAAAAMARINAAYEVLSDTQRRAEYDFAVTASRHRGRVAGPRFIQEVFGWPWYVLAGTALVTVLTLGTVALRFAAPPQPVLGSGSPLALQAPLPDPIPLVPSRRIEPWTEPPRSVRPVMAETEPVMRLVREGTMKVPPTRQ